MPQRIFDFSALIADRTDDFTGRVASQNPAEISDLFFEPIVASYISNPRFLRRDWLAKEVVTQLAKPDCRFVLLTAEPGAGKSTFMAQLAADHPDWPRYFIRRDQRTPLGDVAAQSFLLRIGYQLATLLPELFTQDRVQLAVEQRIGTVGGGGEAVGAEVKRILASPFHQKVVQIQQQVTQNQGKVVGLRIEELVIEPRLLEPAALANMALFDPARALFKLHPAQQIVILVDALDEIRYHDTAEDILRWLTGCPELPPNVRFVLSSRPPDQALDLLTEKQAPHLKPLNIIEQNPDVRSDITAYAERLAADPGLQAAMVEIGQSSASFVESAIEKAHGNIGYLGALARALDQALARRDKDRRAVLSSLLALDQLPDELGDLYAFFLHQIKTEIALNRRVVPVQDPTTGKQANLDLWPAVYEPILAVLCIAFEPLTVNQMHALAGIAADPAYVAEAVDRLGQFMDQENGRHRLYHATLVEFLTAESTGRHPKNRDLGVDTVRWHRQATNGCRGRAATWAAVDGEKVNDYGLRYLARHISLAQPEGEVGRALDDLICRSFMRATYARFKSYQPFGDDVQRAIQARRLESPLDVFALLRLSLIYATLVSLAQRLSPEAAPALVQLGLGQEISGLAALQQDVRQRFNSQLRISQSLLALGQAEQALDILAGLVSTAGLHDLDHHLPDAAYGEQAAALARLGQAPAALEALHNIQDEHFRQRTAQRLPEELARRGDFDEALAVAGQVEADRTATIAGILELAILERGPNEFVRLYARITDPKSAQSAAKEVVYRRLREDDAGSALQIIALSPDPGVRRELIYNVATHLAERKRHEEAIRIVREGIDDERERNRTLAAVWQITAERIGLDELLTSEFIGPKPGRSAVFAQLAANLAAQGRLAEARAVIGVIETTEARANALRELVVSLARAGQGEQVLIWAIPAREGQASGPDDDYTVSRAAIILARQGKLADAWSVALLMAPGYSQSRTLGRLLGLVYAQEGPAAVQGLMAARLPAEKRDEVCRHAAEAQIEAWQLDESRWFISQMGPGWEHNNTQATLAQRYAQVGDLASAQSVATGIAGTWQRDQSLVAIAHELMRSGKTTEALDAIDAIIDTTERAAMLTEIAGCLDARGERQSAQVYARRAATLLEAGDWCISLSTAQRIAPTLTILDNSGMERLAERAERAAVEESSRLDSSRAVRAVLWSAAGASDRSLALTTEIQDTNERVEALGAIALTLAARGDAAHLSEIEARILEIPAEAEPNIRIEASLGTLAATLAQINEDDRASTVLAKIRMDYGIRVALEQTPALLRAGQNEWALKVAARMKDGYARDRARTEIAAAEIDRGHLPTAAETLEAITDSGSRASALGVLLARYWDSPVREELMRWVQALNAPETCQQALSSALSELATRCGTARALAFIEQVSPEEARVSLYGRLLTNLAEHGTTLALAAADAIQPEVAREQALVAAVEHVTLSDLPDTLQALLQRLPRRLDYDTVRGRVAEDLARRGNLDLTFRVAEQAVGDRSRISTWTDVITTLTAWYPQCGIIDRLEAALPPPERDQVLASVVDRLTHQRNMQPARLHEAQELMRRISDHHQRDQALRDIVEGLALVGEKEALLAAANEIGDNFDREMALLRAVTLLAKSGRITQATAVAEAIPEKERRQEAFYPIAEAQVKAGDKAGARHTLESLLAELNRPADDWERESILRRLTFEAIRLEQLDLAMQIARSLNPQLPFRAAALLECAAAFVIKKEKGQAKQVLAEALMAVPEGPLTEEKARLYNDLAAWATHLDAGPGLEKILNAVAAKEKEAAVHSYVLSRIALALADPQTRRWYRRTARVPAPWRWLTHWIEDREWQHHALAAAAPALTAIASFADNSSQAQVDVPTKADCLSWLAPAYCLAGNRLLAAQSAANALVAMRAASGAQRNQYALARVARTFAMLDQEDRAAEASDLALQWSRPLANVHDQVRMLAPVAEQLAYAGAGPGLDRLITAILASTEIQLKVYALEHIAHGLVSARQQDRARELAERAWQTMAALQDPPMISHTFCSACQALLVTGSPALMAHYQAKIASLADPGLQAKLWSEIAEPLWQQDRWDDARHAARQVLTLRVALPEGQTRARALSRVAAVLARLPGPEHEVDLRELVTESFCSARLAGRQEVFDALDAALPALVALDGATGISRVAAVIDQVHEMWCE